MAIKDVRDALLTQIKNDADIIAEFGSNVDYGLGKNISMSLLPKSIRIIQLGIDPEKNTEIGGGYIFANYRFHIVAIFALSSDETVKTAEDRESNYDRLIKKAITKDYELGGSATDVELGRTFFRTHPEKDGVYFVLIEVIVMNYEQESVR